MEIWGLELENNGKDTFLEYFSLKVLDKLNCCYCVYSHEHIQNHLNLESVQQN